MSERPEFSPPDPEMASPPPSPPPDASVGPEQRPARRRPWILIAVLTLASLTAIGGGATAITLHVLREPTDAQIEAAGEEERASRWRALKAADLFPATVHDDSGRYPGRPSMKTARRVGIVPATSCAKAFDPPVAKILDAHGCRTVLRATYTDPSAATVATIGVVVLADASAAREAEGAISRAKDLEGKGLRAVAFPGTVAAGFRDASRRDFWSAGDGSRYMVFRSAGWTVDRGDVPKDVIVERFAFGQTMVDKLWTQLRRELKPCESRRVQC